MPRYREIPRRSKRSADMGIARSAAHDGFEVISEPGKKSEGLSFEPYDPSDHPMPAHYESSRYNDEDC